MAKNNRKGIAFPPKFMKRMKKKKRKKMRNTPITEAITESKLNDASMQLFDAIWDGRFDQFIYPYKSELIKWVPVLLVSMFLFFAGCAPVEDKVEVSSELSLYGYEKEIFVVTIDSCEYVVFNGSKKGGITHKGNCKNH